MYALSGGMAQRLMVARAIFHRPAVLFLDEPTAGLDPQGRLALWEILGELNREGQTILLTTHYMEEADELCDRVAIMDHGRILALDTPAALKQSVGADTIVTVKARGDLQALVRSACPSEIDGVTRTRVIDGGVELHVKGAERLVPRVVNAAESGGSRRGRPVGRPSRASRPSSSTSPARSCATDVRRLAHRARPCPTSRSEPTRSTMAASRIALRALILRDLRGAAQELRRVRRSAR